MKRSRSILLSTFLALLLPLTLHVSKGIKRCRCVYMPLRPSKEAIMCADGITKLSGLLSLGLRRNFAGSTDCR